MRYLRVACCILGFVLVLACLPTAADAQSITYTVKRGDTLGSIAAAHGVTVGALVRANRLANPDRIRVGQRLVIPLAGSPPTAARPKAPAATATPPPTATPTPAATPTATATPTETSTPLATTTPVTLTVSPAATQAASSNTVQPGAGSAAPATPPAATPTPFRLTAYNLPGGGPPTDLAPTRLMVSVAQQRCWLYQDGRNTGTWPCSTGGNGAVTLPGYYTVKTKMPVGYGYLWDWNLPYWLGLYDVGDLENGIHGLPYDAAGTRQWGDDIGKPVTFGCVVLQDDFARQVYSAAELGMQVVIEP